MGVGASLGRLPTFHSYPTRPGNALAGFAWAGNRKGVSYRIRGSGERAGGWNTGHGNSARATAPDTAIGIQLEISKEAHVQRSVSGGFKFPAGIDAGNVECTMGGVIGE